MATRRSTTDASDEVFDFECSPCRKKDRNKEAVKFCVNCQDYLCVTCLEYHSNFSALAGHKFLGRAEFGTASKTKAEDFLLVPTEICKTHAMKIVDMFCADHDSVCCLVCLTLNHKPCRDTHYIPEFVQKAGQASYIKNVEDKVQENMASIVYFITKEQKAREYNEEQKTKLLREIQAFRAEINQTLDRLERNVVAEVNSKFTDLDSTYEKELNDMQVALDNLTINAAEIVTSQNNQCQQFVRSKMCDNLISEIEKKIPFWRKKKRGFHSFRRNPELLMQLKKFNSLGVVYMENLLTEAFQRLFSPST